MPNMKEELSALEQKHLLRKLTAVGFATSTHIEQDGKSYLLFSSNNYLGLANHPILKSAAISAIETWGVGAGASRLVSGNCPLYAELEVALAKFKCTESALVFNSGYTTNIGALGAILKKGDLVLSDRLNHASLIDGARRSEGTFRVYRHKDVSHLKAMLSRRSRGQRAVVVTDGIFSMEGDIAPLPEIVHLAEAYDALVYLDDAHATGVLGPHGRGTCDHFHITNPRIIQMGTLSKALGGFGGLIAANRLLIDYLINKTGPFIYTTALPPSLLASALAAINLIQKDDSFRKKLWQHTGYVRQKVTSLGFDTLGSETPIIPIRVGSSEMALAFSRRLFNEGIYLPAIRPPTVPEGSARLRISLMATHTQEQIDFLLKSLEEIGKELRLI